MTFLVLLVGFGFVAYAFPQFPLWGAAVIGLVLAVATRCRRVPLSRDRRAGDDGR